MPNTPDNLQQSLFYNLDKQIIDEKKSARKKIHNRIFFSSSIAASMLIGLLVLFRVNMATSSVALAYEHAQEEMLITGNMDGGYKQWMLDRGIAIPVNSEAIVLSKNCSLGENKAKHLRFELNRSQQGSTLISKGVINSFVNTSHGKLLSTKDTSGEINGQQWFLFKPDDEIEVLVLYENESYKTQVDNIIKSMFPDRGKTVT